MKGNTQNYQMSQGQQLEGRGKETKGDRRGRRYTIKAESAQNALHLGPARDII